MRILIASSEVAPFAKTGGLGDVTSSLARYLGEAGHDVRLFLPLYGSLREGRDTLVPVEFLQGIPVHLGGREYTISVYTAPIPGSSQWVHFVSCPPLYARKSIYCMDGDEHLRFGLLSVAKNRRHASSQSSPQNSSRRRLWPSWSATISSYCTSRMSMPMSLQ